MIITKEVYAYVSPHFLLATPVEVEGVSSAQLFCNKYGKRILRVRLLLHRLR
jgi:hypothetical protein